MGSAGADRPFAAAHRCGVLMDRPTNPRPPRRSARQLRSELKRQWLAKRAEWRNEELLREWHNKEQRAKVGAKPPKRRRTEAVRAGQLVRGLERAHEVTGNPLYQQTLDQLRKDGLDHEFESNAARLMEKMFGNLLDDYCVQVHYLVEQPGRRQRLTVRAACEQVVAEFGLPGKSFNAAAEQLRKHYPILKRDVTESGIPGSFRFVVDKLRARKLGK
jgi:hypothetical protein